MAKSLIVIPTYNEIDNIREIVPAVLALPHPLEVLVVDDNSPDGTAAAVEEMARARPAGAPAAAGRERWGSGSAYIAGFRWALERDYAVVFEMDADFSHDPGRHSRRSSRRSRTPTWSSARATSTG